VASEARSRWPARAARGDRRALERRAPERAAPPARVEVDGGLVAALVAAALGCAMLGILVVLAEASEGVAGFLNLYEPVGPLSGKTTFATVAYLASWPPLHLALRGRAIDFSRALAVVVALLAVALLGTFPPFFGAFG
jgi:hypothetical protein